MDSIIELEKRVIKSPKKAKPEDSDVLARHYWDLAMGTEDFREKRKHLKRSSFFAGLAFTAGADTVEQLALYRTIVQHAAEVSASPEYERRKLSKIIARWLEKTGADQQEVLNKAKGKTVVEGGLISLGDRARFTPWGGSVETSDKVIVERVNRGERLTFETGGDGVYKAELRLIDAAEPVRTAQQYKKLRSSTPVLVIDVSSGAPGTADDVHFSYEPWDKKYVDGTVCLNVPPGRYKACAYGFSTPSGYESVIGVVTATSDEARNETKTPGSLFYRLPFMLKHVSNDELTRPCTRPLQSLPFLSCPVMAIVSHEIFYTRYNNSVPSITKHVERGPPRRRDRCRTEDQCRKH